MTGRNSAWSLPRLSPTSERTSRWREQRAPQVLLIGSVVLAAVASVFVGEVGRLWLGGLLASLIILGALPLLLSACRPAAAAIIALTVVFLAGALLLSTVATGALREAMRPAHSGEQQTLGDHMTMLVTLLSVVSLVAGVLGFLFSAADHDFDE